MKINTHHNPAWGTTRSTPAYKPVETDGAALRDKYWR